MGVVLDSSILIAGERRRDSVSEVLERVEVVCGKTTAVLSAVTAVELTHGIYRAKTDADRKRREALIYGCCKTYQDNVRLPYGFSRQYQDHYRQFSGGAG